MLMKAFTLPLLDDDPIKGAGRLRVQYEISKPGFRIRDRQKASQLTFGPGDSGWRGSSTALQRRRSISRLIHELSKLYREPTVPTPGGLRRNLHRNGVEPSVITFRMAADQRFYVISFRHLILFGSREH